MTDLPFGGARLVPVVVIDDADTAEPIGEALLAGGLRAGTSMANLSEVEALVAGAGARVQR